VGLFQLKTRVVNIRKEPYDVYIGRPGKWGNCFIIGKDGTRAEVIVKYKNWITTEGSYLLKDMDELSGKRLGCYCAPLACHGDVLVWLVEEYTN
jgi:hypothetical protein